MLHFHVISYFLLCAMFCLCLGCSCKFTQSVTVPYSTTVSVVFVGFRSGMLPAPPVPRAIGRYMFDRMRDLDTIRAFLDNSYSRKEAYDETLVQQIRQCTDGNGGHAAFASIMWSPPINSQQVRRPSSIERE